MPRSLVRYAQIRRLGTPDVQESDSAYAEGRYFEANCLAADAINQLVRVVGLSLGVPDVTKVDVTNLTQMPAVGVIVQKPTAITCLVQTSGQITSFSPVVVGARYFVGATAFPTDTPPDLPAIQQVVGTGLGPSRLLLQIATNTAVLNEVGTISATCLATDAVGDFARVAGPIAGSVYDVTKADPSDSAKMPAMGMIVQKTTTTSCFVRTLGLVTVPGFPALTVGKLTFIGLDGKPTTVPPSAAASITGFAMVQSVGIAVATNKVELNILPTFVKTRT